MKAIVLGYHNVGCIGIEALIRNGFTIQAVFTHKDDPKENTWFGSVAELCASRNIPVYAPNDVNHPIWVQKIKEFAPDFIFSFYYRNMVKSEILSIPSKGCLNLHGSLLPKYRGRCPVNWVLVHGEKETGVTLHYMTAKPDDGDIIGSKKITIHEDDTALNIFEKMGKEAKLLLDETLPQLLKGTAERTSQDHSKATYFGGRSAKDGQIDWNKSALEIKNLIRAVTKPYPGAFAYFGTKKIIIWSAKVTDKKGTFKPGTVISQSPLTIACGKDALLINSLSEENGLTISGSQSAEELGILTNTSLTSSSSATKVKATKSVLILGVNGFIGSALSEKLLATGKYEVHGMDLYSDKIKHLIGKPGFYFDEGDISIHREWIEYHVRKCDIVIPLVAIATPIEYV
ncbi:MAG: hypothetical protein ACD_79C00492G0003, partial [uncultured bacterium]